MKRLLALLCAMALACGTASAETLRVYSVNVPETFRAAHPGLTIEEPDWERDQSYSTTSEFAGAFLTRSFGWDVFSMGTRETDTDVLMEKGYLLDLSGSEVIREAIDRVYPFIRERCVKDGKIYAVPSHVYVYDPDVHIALEVMEDLGYTVEDLPQTFPALLDFIEEYLDRRDREPELDYCVWANLAQEVYGEHSYADILIRLLVRSHVRQCQYAGIPIRFNTPEMVALLERTKAVADRIFTYEPVRPYDDSRSWPGILDSYTWLGEQYPISVRISEDQPMLRTADITLTAVYAATDKPDLAIEAVEDVLQNINDYWAYRIFADTEPVPNSDYESTKVHWNNMIALAQHRVDGDETPWREYLDLSYGEGYYDMNSRDLWDGTELEAQNWLDYWQECLLYTETQQWLVSPETIDEYHELSGSLFLQGPSPFTSTREGEHNFYQLQNQFADGLITAQQFAVQADNMAMMIELENQ